MFRVTDEQGNRLYNCGDLDGAMKSHKAQETVCRLLGNTDGVSASLSAQARVLCARGNLDGAMKLLKQVEAICREVGKPCDLAISLMNRSIILGLGMGMPREALALGEEAYRLVSSHGFSITA